MKNISMVVVCAFLGVLTLLMVMTVQGRSSRSMELKTNFSSAAEETVAALAADPAYGTDNADQFVADFTQGMVEALDSNMAVSAEVMNVNRERGLLSLRITGEFKHPNGKPGTVQDERTVVFNRTDEPEPQVYTVGFYMTDAQGQTETYKEYRVPEGEKIPEPSDPVQSGRTFAGWTDGNGYLADFSGTVTQDMDYYASWE